LQTSGPSLPVQPEDTLNNIGPVTINIDTWNINVDATAGAAGAAGQRPFTQRQRLWLPPINPRPPVNGPAAPRSWLSPRPAATQGVINGQPRPQIRANGGPILRTKKQRKSSRRNVQRANELDRQTMEELYEEEYWFRSARDPRWSSWRDVALHLVFSRMAMSSHTPRAIGASTLSSSGFVPFEQTMENSKIPTLFEMTLRVIFDAIQRSEPSGEEEDIVDLIDILGYLPPYTQRSVLRYAALHHQLDEKTLLAVYGSKKAVSSKSGDENSEDPTVKDELVLSGRDVPASILDQLSILDAKPTFSSQERIKEPQIATNSTTITTTTTNATLIDYPQAIVLFQTPFLQKRHFTLFPVTITTLALLALPPPSTYNRTRELESSIPCLCRWCTTHSDELARFNGTTGPQMSRNDISSAQRRQQDHSPAPPTTSTSLVSSLTNLPTLFPSLVTLDVSYNSWMSAESTLANIKVPPAPKGRAVLKEYGILGRWDLRLWGRLKILGVRGCFEHRNYHQVNTAEPEVEVPREQSRVHRDGDACERMQTKVPLVERWERNLFLMERTVEVVWNDDSLSPRMPRGGILGAV
ncbi:hypothetical protein FRC17_010620, partial [Serendipita sp. 399]